MFVNGFTCTLTAALINELIHQIIQSKNFKEKFKLIRLKPNAHLVPLVTKIEAGGLLIDGARLTD